MCHQLLSWLLPQAQDCSSAAAKATQVTSSWAGTTRAVKHLGQVLSVWRWLNKAVWVVGLLASRQYLEEWRELMGAMSLGQNMCLSTLSQELGSLCSSYNGSRSF